MRIRPHLPEDFLETPYDSGSEALSRVDLALRLSRMYSSLEHGTVALLHGRWGSGKTTFVKKWSIGLDQEGFATNYFSAFENDYVDNPFVALSASILRQLEARRGKNDAAIRSFKSKAVAVSKKLIVAGAKVGVKAGTLCALSISDLDMTDEISGTIADAAADLAERAAESILEEQSKAEATFSVFRAGLSEIIADSGDQDGDQKGRYIFIIDELDRCRPDFALKLIETLKHFFDVDGLHFVLVANKEFLQNSVTHRYGLGSSSKEYLDKFFDFSIFFEESGSYRNSSAPVVYTRKVIADLLGSSSEEARDIEESVAEIAGAFDLTFRQIERIASTAALAHASHTDKEYRPAYLIAYLCFLKCMHPDAFAKIKQRKFEYTDIEKILRAGDWEEHSNIERILEILEFHSSKEIDENGTRFRGFRQSFFGYNFRDRLEVLPYLANSVVDRFALL